MTPKGSVDTLGVLGHWTASGDILVGYVTFNDHGLPSLFARCNNLKDAETVAAALNDHRGAVEAERERIVAMVREEARRAFDTEVGAKFRMLADRITASGGQ